MSLVRSAAAASTPISTLTRATPKAAPGAATDRRALPPGRKRGAEASPPPAAPVDGLEVVQVVSQPLVCAECRHLLGRGDLAHFEAQKALCLGCALLDQLVLLPSGDVALTRRASARSKVKAVVVEWSRRGKRYERRGTLVEPEALRLARLECETDAAQRAQQRAQAAVRREAEDQAYIVSFTREVKRLFPGCPLSEARKIAAHACAKHSGRVGRTAAAKELDEEMVRLAVIAHVRHLHTDYDRIIARTRDKRGARDRIRNKVTAVLQEWERGSPATE